MQEKETWLLGAVKRAAAAHLAMLRGTGQGAKWKTASGESFLKMRWLIIKSVFEKVAATMTLISVSVTILLMQLMVGALVIVAPKAFVKRNKE